MRVDIEQLSEVELIDLNHRIVARLQLLRQLEAHAGMLEFSIGERVTFHPEGRPAVIGMITRYNKRTVSVVTDDGHRWNVAPQFMQRLEVKMASGAGASNVITLPRPDKTSR